MCKSRIRDLIWEEKKNSMAGNRLYRGNVDGRRAMQLVDGKKEGEAKKGGASATMRISLAWGLRRSPTRQ
jgi:hypothetical protein